MDSEKNHINYSAEAIQNYFSGRLTPAEMHAMEKAALEDIFLAEAMEGYGEMKEKDWERQLKLLKSNFEEKQNSKVITMKQPASYAMWKVAAAVILICSVVAITYLFTSRNPMAENPGLATTTKQDSINSVSTVQGNGDTIEKKVTPDIENTKTTEQALVKRVDPKPVADSTFLYRPDIVLKKKADSPSGGEFAEDQLKGRSDLASNKVAPSAQQNKPEQDETKSTSVNNQPSKDTEYFKKAETTYETTYKAQVVGPDGSPLPFANIRTNKNQPGTYTDVRGNFSLKSADTLVKIEVKSIGYVSGNFSLRSDSLAAKLVLKTDENALKEKSHDDVTVTGYGTTRKSASMPAPPPSMQCQ